MGHEEKLARLEQVVTRMLASYDTLKAEHNELQARLREREQSNRDLQEQVESLRNDREMMHSRVTTLIDKVMDWEKEQDGGPGQGDAPPAASDDQPVEDSMPIFSMGVSQGGESPAG